jgi:hypothetical protein
VIKDLDKNWCEVEYDEKTGVFPKNKLRRANEEEEKEKNGKRG